MIQSQVPQQRQGRGLIFLILFVFASTVLPKSTDAAEAVRCELKVYQLDSSTGKNILLRSDTSLFVKGIAATGFLTSFSTDIDIDEIDSVRTSMTVHVITLGPTANTYSKRFSVEYGLPARIENIAGKGDSKYTLSITPLEAIDIDTSFCPYDHRAKGVFKFDPSAHMDIYYVENSLGDFYWNGIKALFEEEYRKYKARFNFNLPGKYLLYLCPCPTYAIIWDQRFGTMVDPTRYTAYTVYSHDLNSADPFVINHVAVLRNYGYAPPFLSIGLANYFSSAPLGMKRLFEGGKDVPLADLLDSYNYFKADQEVAEFTSGTVARYLVDEFGVDKFRQMYKQADDLNLTSTMEETYGRSIAEIETGWKNYVDTMSVDAAGLIYFADRAETMFDYRGMLRYSGDLMELQQTKPDSMRALSIIKRAYFFNGDYYRAANAQQQLVDYNPADLNGQMALGSYRLMSGYVDAAGVVLKQAYAQDSTSQIVAFNLALYHVAAGEESKARDLLSKMIAGSYGSQAQAESRIVLANLLMKSSDKNDHIRATTLYRQTLERLQSDLVSNASSATMHLWMGIAFFGVEDTGNAYDYLQTALFLESRPFYLGMINLWLGKLADVRGERSLALDHYGLVISELSADYHQKEAKKYITEPFSR